MLHCAVWYKTIDVSEVLAVSISTHRPEAGGRNRLQDETAQQLTRRPPSSKVQLSRHTPWWRMEGEEVQLLLVLGVGTRHC
jgi:hypothetical protein